jgi:hypothetical protein
VTRSSRAAGDVRAYNSLRVSVIFPFLLVVIFVAIRFGAVAAMVGSSVSAVVFSCFMLPPIGSFSIEDPVAKQNLLWFVVAGISLGYLLRQSHRTRRKALSLPPFFPASDTQLHLYSIFPRQTSGKFCCTSHGT